jgi:predicted O-linked N-acetylglucosamine transferase (SPINDLY family)
MRGRHVLGFYKLMDTDEAIAADKKDYVSRVVRLGCDPEVRNNFSALVRERSSVFIRDHEYIAQLENFILSKCG